MLNPTLVPPIPPCEKVCEFGRNEDVGVDDPFRFKEPTTPPPALGICTLIELSPRARSGSESFSRTLADVLLLTPGRSVNRLACG
jgi:hypothetical protein